MEGPPFAVLEAMPDEDQPIDWSFSTANQIADGTWEFAYESEPRLWAVCQIELDRDFRVAKLTTRLQNRSDHPSTPLSELSALSLLLKDLPGEPKMTSSSGGAFARQERRAGMWFDPSQPPWWTRWHMPLPRHGVRFSNGPDTGLSSAQDLPIVIVSTGSNSDDPGFFSAMDWSGMWDARFGWPGATREPTLYQVYRRVSPALAVAMGPRVKGLVLEAGETLELPTVHLGFFQGGWEAGSNVLRRYIAQRIAPRHKGKLVVPPVVWHLWPGIRSPDPIEKEVYQYVDIAGDLGVEICMIDDVWFRDGHPHGIGNWQEDDKRWKHGLEALSEHIRSRGMGLGLFLSAECAAPDTQSLREHPEFFYPGSLDKWMPQGSRLFNFGLPQTCEYVFEQTSHVLDRYHVSYIQWELDADPMPIWKTVDPTGKVQFAHYRGLYSVLERLAAKHPDLLIQCTAVGGHRLDLGIMKRSHCGWFFEVMTDPHSSHRLQLSANVFIPPHYLGYTLGNKPLKEHTGVDETLSDLSFISRMAGTFFINGRLTDWNDEQLERAKHWISIFTNVRHLLVKDYCRLFPQPQNEADWDAGQFSGEDGQGVVLVFRQQGRTGHQQIRLRSLDPNSSYRFTDQTTGEHLVHKANVLLTNGLSVSLEANSAKMYFYERNDHR